MQILTSKPWQIELRIVQFELFAVRGPKNKLGNYILNHDADLFISSEATKWETWLISLKGYD